jgi:hypothetical protein
MIFRLFLAAACLLVGASFAVYFFTREPRYLRLAWQLFRFFVVLFAAGALFYIVERLVLV